MDKENHTHLEIGELQSYAEAEICARIMANSEPWITLRRDYDASLKTITASSREVYLARVDGEMAGFTILNLHGAFVCYIQSVCIAPQWRNKGIGRQLIAWAEKRIFRETSNVFMCVSDFNKDAQRLYERLGYEVIGELKDYIISGHSEILLRKTIAPLVEFKKK